MAYEKLVVYGALLLVLTWAPAQEYITPYLSHKNIGRLVTALQWIITFKVVGIVNSFLSELAHNNFRLRAEKQRWNWNKEIVLITGGSSGFGALFSKDLAAKGLNVVCLDVNEPAKELLNNPKVHFFRCDVTSHDQVMAVAREVQSKVGHPTVLINNAGLLHKAPVLEMAPERVRKLFEVNLISHYSLCQAFVPNMIQNKKGHIVSLASMASFTYYPTMSSYMASKAGLLSFHYTLASELRSIHKCPEIQTTIIHPGWADTAMLKADSAEVKGQGFKLLAPQVVSDAVVKQIMSCRGDQVVLMQGGGLLKTMKEWPAWVWMLGLRPIEKRVAKVYSEA